MISAPVRSDAFVGRGEELLFLHARASETIEGKASVVVLSGDQGIGKSRLLDEFFTRHQGTIRVVRVRCSPAVQDAGSVLNVLCEALASLLRREPPEPPDAARALAYVRSAIRTAKSAGAVAIVVEDLQHATNDAIDVLEHVAGVERTMLLLTIAPGDAPVGVREAFARLIAHNAYEMRLAPLPAEAMRRMIRRFHVERGVLPRVLVTRVIELAHGNPSLAQELVRAAAESGGGIDTPVPHSVQLRARRMLDALDGRARNLLLIAAAIGAQFDTRTLARVAGERVPAVLEGLQAAVMCGLVRETNDEHFAFAQPLFREALQLETTQSFAAPYHRRAALLLQRTAQSADAYQGVAEQWRGAGDTERAAAWDERAGDAAIEAEDFVHGAAAYRRALRGLRDGATLRSLLFKRANALRRAGLEREAAEAFEEYLARASGDDAQTRAKALLQKLMLLWSAGDFKGVDALGTEILALELPDDTFVKARTMVQFATLRWSEGRFEETRALLERAEREYPTEDAETLGLLYQQRALVIHSERSFDDAIDDFQRGIAYMERSGNRPLYGQQLCNFGNMALLHAHNELALEMLERACAVARNVPSQSKLYFVLASYARALMRVGRNAEAHEVLDELWKSDADITELNALYTVVAMLELGSMLGDAALAERAIDSDVLPLAFESGDPQRILPLASAFALHQWHAGEEEAASALLHRALVATERVTWNYSFAVLVAQFGPLQDLPRARRMLELPLVVGEPRVIAAFLDLFDAFVARRRGRNTVAASIGRKAASEFEAIGWPYYQAQAHEVAGDHAEALRIYDRIGDVRDAEKLRAALRPPRRSGRHAIALTAREREVGLLALDGLSSAQIAARLGIGVRTVEHHLQVLYGKFGIRSRWQLPHDL